MFRRWCFALALTAAPAVWMTSAAAAPADVTATAETSVVSAEKAAGQVALQRQALAQRYAEQTAAIDRIKQQKPSWRRDRELRTALADAADTATQLATLTHDAATAQVKLADARRAVVTAIDAELAAGASGARAQQLTAERARFAPATPAAHKIVIPNSDLDPLADPEDLDKEAGALRQTEGELQRQVDELDHQQAALKQAADARKEHDRAVDLASRDDNEPHRTSPHATSRESNSAGGGAGGGSVGATPTDPAAGTASGDAGHSTGITSFEGDATIVLADVVDATTIDSLARAQRSGDPGQRAAAAKQARDSVANRLAQLRAKRAAIEARAKSLRKH